MYKSCKDYIANNGLLHKDQKVLVAVSGGADSMCLLSVLQSLAAELPIKLAVCHVNHCLRGAESDSDADFVKQYCHKHALECEVLRVDVKTFAQQHGMSVEQAARTLRYNALYTSKDKFACDVIATAHNKNDQAETFLLNMLRGAAINGLKGMLPRHGDIIRPLLDTQRQDIELYCESMQLEYCHDSSNDSLEYLRNRIRHELLPTLQEYNPNIINSLTSNMQSIRIDAEYLTEQAQIVAVDMLHTEDKKGCISVHLDLAKLRQLHSAIAFRVLLLAIERQSGSAQGINRAHLMQIYRLAQDDTGSKKLVLPNDILVRKFYDKITIGHCSRDQADQGLEKLYLTDIGSYAFGTNKIVITKETHTKLPKSSSCEIYLPCDILAEHRLCVRSRLSGDGFALKGGGRKSVKSFFIDQKIPSDERSRVPLLFLDERLIAILGYRCILPTVPSDTQEYLAVKLH